MRFAEVQGQLANHLRDPLANEPPSDVEDRRLAIYRDLVFANIESFISGGFPVLRSLYRKDDWQRLVRTFIVRHRSASPYFLKIGEEFLEFLQNSYQPCQSDPPFLLELAHYEWVELALDVADVDLEGADPASIDPQGDLLEGVPVVSPLAWCLSYTFPVHRISRDFIPDKPSDQPVFLVVWRNRDEQVRFMEANGATVRLLQILSDAPVPTGREALERLAQEMEHPDPEALIEFGASLLVELAGKDIVLGVWR